MVQDFLGGPNLGSVREIRKAPVYLKKIIIKLEVFFTVGVKNGLMFISFKMKSFRCYQ